MLLKWAELAWIINHLARVKRKADQEIEAEEEVDTRSLMGLVVKDVAEVMTEDVTTDVAVVMKEDVTIDDVTIDDVTTEVMATIDVAMTDDSEVTRDVKTTEAVVKTDDAMKIEVESSNLLVLKSEVISQLKLVLLRIKPTSRKRRRGIISIAQALKVEKALAENHKLGEEVLRKPNSKGVRT